MAPPPSLASTAESPPPSGPAAVRKPGTSLRRGLGLMPAAALVVGGTIGVGIFLAPAGMAKSLGSPALLFAVWAFMGATSFCGALCFGELAARFPEAGGSYVYLRESFGPLPAFLYGWKCLLVMDPGLTAALASGLGAHVAVLVPWLAPKAAALLAVAAVAAANLAGLRVAAGIAQFLAVSKVAVLLLLVGFGFQSAAGQWSHFTPFLTRHAGAPPVVTALAGAVVAAFFAFGGWWEASKLAGEVRDPQRALPRAFGAGVAVVTLLYVAVSAVFVYLVPLHRVGSGETFAAQAGAVLFGPRGRDVLAAIVALSVLGSLCAFMTSAPRVYYAMGRDGAVPTFVARLDPRTGAPARAVLLQAALSALLVAVGSFDQIASYFVFVTVAFLGLTVAGLFKLRRASPEAPYRAPFFPVTPVLFLASVAVVMVLLALGRPVEAILGLIVVALGWPAYAVLFRKESP